MTLLTDLVRDLRYASRALLRTPAFTVVATLVLALGIGSNTAMFSFVSAVWLEPLPFARADRLVTLWADLRSFGGSSAQNQPAPGNYADWSARAQSFEAMAGLEFGTFNLTGAGEPERLDGVRATPNLFATVGLAPLLGRTFQPDDGAGAPVVVIGERFWLRRFGGDTSVIGRSIVLDGVAHTVVGVVPPDLRFPYPNAELWVPTVFTSEVLARRTSYYWHVIARLRPDVSIEQARAEMDAVAATLRAEDPRAGAGVTIVPLHEHLAQALRPTVVALLGAVALVLLIACANVANLLLARAALRQRELAIRKALGAGHARVFRQLLTESLILAAAGAALGTLVAAGAFGYLARLVPQTFPVGAVPSLDLRVLAFAIGIALVTVVLAGAGPAVAAARRDVATSLGKAVTGSSGPKARRLRRALVVAEVALTVVLLAGAGLLLRSYQQVLAVDPGFRADGLLLAETALPPARYPEAVSVVSFSRRALERVRALPGVSSAGYANFAPLSFKGGNSIVMLEGRPPLSSNDILRNLANNRAASPDYLETLGVPLVRGRHLAAADTLDAPLVAVVNETMARKFWPGEEAVGQRFRTGMMDQDDERYIEVVGVVGDVRQTGLDVPAEAELYLSLEQATSINSFFSPRHLVVRSAGDPAALAAAVRNAIWSVDAAQPVSGIRPMTDVLDAELGSRSTQLTVIGAFALMALALASVGLYGVLSYTVAQSTREIGLRMALGARQHAVVVHVLSEAAGTAALGIGIGLVAALALTRALASFLYGVSPADPLTGLAVISLLLTVAGLAALVPAWRAARVDPMTALNAEG